MHEWTSRERGVVRCHLEKKKKKKKKGNRPVLRGLSEPYSRPESPGLCGLGMDTRRPTSLGARVRHGGRV